MYYFLKIKKLIIKFLTCWIIPYSFRKNARNFLFYFSFSDFVRFKNQKYKIVSLGTNCLPRVLTTAAKLKPRKIYGEKTGPFDLSCHYDIQKVAELIENDFENFFDNLYFNETWQNNYLKAAYPHDKKLSRKQFEKRYKKRIQNFKQLLNYPKIVYFIFADYDKIPDKKDLIRLLSVLEKKREGKPFRLVILTAKEIEDFHSPYVIQLIDNFKIEHENWVESFINDYGSKHNKYSDYCIKTGGKLSKIIKKHQS